MHFAIIFQVSLTVSFRVKSPQYFCLWFINMHISHGYISKLANRNNYDD